jgi:hypothetical protein
LEDEVTILQAQYDQLCVKHQTTEKKLQETEFELQLMKNLFKGLNPEDPMQKFKRFTRERAQLKGVVGKVRAAYCPAVVWYRMTDPVECCS